jgi:hypothetical protein
MSEDQSVDQPTLSSRSSVHRKSVTETCACYSARTAVRRHTKAATPHQMSAIHSSDINHSSSVRSSEPSQTHYRKPQFLERAERSPAICLTIACMSRGASYSPRTLSAFSNALVHPSVMQMSRVWRPGECSHINSIHEIIDH